MKRDIAKLWAAALPRYKQTTNTLRNGDRFCCLGVLCNLHAQAHPKIARRQESLYFYMGETTMPTDAVLRWAGLSRVGAIHLAGFNDRGMPFPAIADKIKTQWSTL